jgi:hypothetical protein
MRTWGLARAVPCGHGVELPALWHELIVDWGSKGDV